MRKSPERMPDQLNGIVQVYDINPELDEWNPQWRNVLTKIALEHAEATVHTGHDDPNSCMQPGDPPIIAYRVRPSVVEREAPGFNVYLRDITLPLAEARFKTKLTDSIAAAGDEDSAYDLNLVERLPDGGVQPDGEVHYDSMPYVGLFGYAGFDDKTIRTEFIVGGRRETLVLPIGHLALFSGNQYPHRALYGSDPAFHSGTGNVRGSVSPAFYSLEGPGSYSSVQRAKQKRIIYGSASTTDEQS